MIGGTPPKTYRPLPCEQGRFENQCVIVMLGNASGHEFADRRSLYIGLQTEVMAPIACFPGEDGPGEILIRLEMVFCIIHDEIMFCILSQSQA